MLRRLIFALIAVVVPPLGVWLARGRGMPLIVVLMLFAAAQAIFWLVAAGPGVALWGLSLIAGVVLALVPTRRTVSRRMIA